MRGLITDDNAAIALPPQIAVPPDIKIDVFLSTFKNLPISKPIARVSVTEQAVKKKLVFDVSITCVRLIPNPIITIEACNRYFVSFDVENG